MKKGKNPLVSFRTVEIRPIRRIIETEKQNRNVSGSVALHMCRGHFKDYREHGLFGKEKGIYWWDAHVRGKAENGIVDKDYRVLTE